MEYISRIVDDVIDRKTEAFNAVSITGPKGCGKTRTARERCKTVIEFQDEDKREGYLAVAETAPKLFLKNPKPILFDEWQDAPKIWGTIRKACDDNPESVGEFYLTGSSSKKINTPHTGTGRITEVTMYPMTLFETGESNGSISLFKLLQDEAYDIDNGFLVTANVDALFDKYLISVKDDGTVVTSKTISDSLVFDDLGIQRKIKPEYISEKKKKYLAFHKEKFDEREKKARI